MGDAKLLPRLVLFGGRGLSADGVVPESELVEAVDRALQDFGKILVWDLDGIQRNRPSLGVVRRFEGEALWVDAGIRTAESVIDVLVAGAERAVVGTKTLVDLRELDEARDLTENLAILLDFEGGEFTATKGLGRVSPLDLLRHARELGITSALLLDEDAEVPRDLLGTLPQGMEAFAGVFPEEEAASLPAGMSAIVDLWEVIPRKM